MPKKYLKRNISKYRYILLKPCGKWYNICDQNNCFTQAQFKVSHRYVEDELSKVTYSLLIKDELGDAFTRYLGKCHCYELAYKIYCADGKYWCNLDELPIEACEDAFNID